ncbi:MAG: SGNH/GDSL hydrolase family protein [Acidimicrobiales bacterium]
MANVGLIGAPAGAAAPIAPAVAPAPALADAAPETHTETTEPDTAAETTEPELTVESTDPEDGLASLMETDPARRTWLQFVEAADPESFAGGAELRDLVEGRRVLMIGDSVMASTSPRYGGEMCKEVTPKGWDVEIDAESGRFVDFGDRVLDQRLDDDAEDFEVAVVMLGNNYGANQDVFEEYLRDIVDRLAPRPTVLLTVTMYEPNRKDVNDTIYDIAMDYDNVRIIDWERETEDNPSLTGGDGLHLSDLGRARYADLVAEELGRAPGFGEGDCLGSEFTDDSAATTGTVEGQVTMPPSTWPSNPSSGGGGGGGTPTVPPTTTGGGGSVPPATSDGDGGGGGGGTLPPPTSPTTSGPGPTDPGPTAPPGPTDPPPGPTDPPPPPEPTSPPPPPPPEPTSPPPPGSGG